MSMFDRGETLPQRLWWTCKVFGWILVVSVVAGVVAGLIWATAAAVIEHESRMADAGVVTESIVVTAKGEYPTAKNPDRRYYVLVGKYGRRRYFTDKEVWDRVGRRHIVGSQPLFVRIKRSNYGDDRIVEVLED